MLKAAVAKRFLAGPESAGFNLNIEFEAAPGVTVLYGAAIVLFNLLVDLCYAWIDPRVRFG